MSKIGESFFDSTEFDDGFFSKVDAEIEKKEKNLEIVKNFSNKSPIKKVIDEENVYNCSSNAQDLNTSNLVKFISKIAEKNKVDINKNNGALFGWSPIQKVVLSERENQPFSSTPLKMNSSVFEKKSQEKETKTKNFDIFEADLFVDWNQEDFMVNKEEEKNDDDYITLSQAFNILEEAELEKKNKLKKEDDEEPINRSLNLLTGEGGSGNSKNPDGFSDESIVIMEMESKEKKTLSNSNNDSHKPQAAQRLNFGSEEIKKDDIEFGVEGIYLSSDDDFDAFIDVKKKKTLKNTQKNKKSKKDEVFSDESFNSRKRKSGNGRVIESDTDESSSPMFSRETHKKRKEWRKSSQVRLFIESDVEVSDKSEISSDEKEENDEEYEQSFVDEASYFGENYTHDIMAKYLESVKNIGGRAGNFKIPKSKPYIPANVYSQMPEESNTDYELDSFCVEEVEEETKTELSELEIVEKILEMDENKKRKKLKELKG